MKNLAHLPIDVIERDYENQGDPFDSWDRYWRNDRNSDYHKVNDYSPYVHVKRIIKLYLGKSFDEAFSRYCKLVPKYQQKVFLKEFDGKYPDCYIDNDGNIQLSEGT